MEISVPETPYNGAIPGGLPASSLKFQLDCLKIEIEVIDRAISRLDAITQATKNWAIGTWTASMALALGQPELRKYIAFIAILPLVFWIVDAHWRSLQKRSIFREAKISDFLNDERLSTSFKASKLVDFTVLDPVGHQYRHTPEYRKATSIWKAAKYVEVAAFYGGLAAVSLAVGLLFLFQS